MLTKNIYKITAELKGFEPKITRTFLLSDASKMMQLSAILMEIFQIKQEKFNCFEKTLANGVKLVIGNLSVACENKEIIPLMVREDEKFNQYSLEKYKLSLDNNLLFIDFLDVRLRNIFAEAGDKMDFNYSYNENWQFDITLEEIIDKNKVIESELPKVLTGSGFGIIENCGGVLGLATKRVELLDKTSLEYRKFCATLRVKNFNFDYCDLVRVNRGAKRANKTFKMFYPQIVTAEEKWSAIPWEEKKEILANICCETCGPCKMAKRTIKDVEFGILLEGKCNLCDSDIEYFVEILKM